MKKHFIFLVFLLGVFVLSSCHTTQTFTVHGTPGTVISKGQQQLAVIDQSGQSTITLKTADGYAHFLNAQAPGSNIPVPFALDYKNHSRSAEAGLCVALMVIPPIVGMAGLIAAAVNHKHGGDTKTPALIGCAGLVLWVPAIFVFVKSDFPDFDYLDDQSTNNDLIQ